MYMVTYKSTSKIDQDKLDQLTKYVGKPIQAEVYSCTQHVHGDECDPRDVDVSDSVSALEGILTNVTEQGITINNGSLTHFSHTEEPANLLHIDNEMITLLLHRHEVLYDSLYHRLPKNKQHKLKHPKRAA